MKPYNVKITKKQKELIKNYWHQLKDIKSEFDSRVSDLEKELEREVNVEGIEFFMCDNEYVGVGNADRTMRLIQTDELEKIDG
jgi:hypothetical protein